MSRSVKKGPFVEKSLQEKIEASGESRDWMFSKDVRFHFVNSKTLNAFTTGGEHMYIYSELFRTAQTEDDGTVMALRHRTHPIHGVQFHPESIMTREGQHMLRNFLKV